MANPLETLRKIRGRSWAEIRSRGGQAVTVYAEQSGLSGKLPTDDEFERLLKLASPMSGTMQSSGLREQFFETAETNFFPSFRQDSGIFELYNERFGGDFTRAVLVRADRLCVGKFDLLGLGNLDLGKAIDWHFEPVSKKRSPLRHWKQFDELATDETGDKKFIWELNRHQHFFTLGVAFGLTGDEQYAETFVRHLESWMEQNPPGMGINWFSSLEVAFRAMSWIWAFNLFRSSRLLTAELLYKAFKFLHLHGRHLERYLSTYYSPNTHLTGEALGLYYLGTQLPFFKRAERWQELGSDILFAELDRQILPDGGYFEQSTWYHRYTLDFYTQFLILHTVAGNRSKNFLERKLISKIQAMLSFQMYLMRPDGLTPQIGDDDGGRCLPLGNAVWSDFRACLSTGAALFNRGDYKFAAEHFSEESLWLLGREGLGKFEALSAIVPEKRSFAFEASGYYVMRDGWDETDNYLLVDCGELGALKGGHGHADALAVNLAVGGKALLVDPGTYSYHESRSLRDHFRTTAAHNTIMIDNQSQSEPAAQFSWRTKAAARRERWISEPRFDFFEGAHDGYERFADAAATHTRRILFLKNDYWIMSDFVRAFGEHDYSLNFLFNAGAAPKIEMAESGRQCVSESSAEAVGLRIFTFGDSGEWRNTESFISPCYGKRVPARQMQYISSGSGNTEFLTFLLPWESGFPKPEVFETEISGGRAVVVKYRNYQDLLVIADGDRLVRNEFFSSNFRFLWSRLSEADSLPEEFVMIGGSHFILNGQEIINYPKEIEFATARRLGSQLNMRTPESVLSITLPD